MHGRQGMTELTNFYYLDVRGERELDIKGQAATGEMDMIRNMDHYGKEFNINISRVSAKERNLRNSMKAYTDKMTEISRRHKKTDAFVADEESSLVIRARHISRNRPLTKLKGETERLHLLRDHLSRSYESLDHAATSDGRRSDQLRRSLPNMKISSSTPKKEDYKMSFVDASDLLDVLDTTKHTSTNVRLRKGNVRLEPLERRNNVTSPTNLVVNSKEKPLSKTGDVKYRIIRTKKSRNKKQEHTEHVKPTIVAFPQKELEFSSHLPRKESLQESVPGRSSEGVQEGYHKTTESRVQAEIAPRSTKKDPESAQPNSSTDKARFSPDEFDKQLRAAITRSKKAKRMKMRAPNLGAIQEDESESEDETEHVSALRESGKSDSNRKVARRSSPEESLMSLKPMLAAIPELMSPEKDDQRITRSLGAIKLMRKTGSKEELLKHQQAQVHKLQISTQQMDARSLLSGNKQNTAKHRARKQIRTGSQKLKLKFVNDTHLS